MSEPRSEVQQVWRRHECTPPDAPPDLIEQAKERPSDTIVAQWKCPTCGSQWSFANWYTVGHTSCWWHRDTVRLIRPPRSRRKRWWRREADHFGRDTHPETGA